MDGNSIAKVVFKGSQYKTEGYYTKELCLEMGKYKFTIFDGYGYDICCSSGKGY